MLSNREFIIRTLNSSTSIKRQRPSCQSTTRNQSVFNLTEVQPTLKSGLLTQDGGNSTDFKVSTLSTKKERSLTFKVESIPTVEESLSIQDTEESTNNGRSFMLTLLSQIQLLDTFHNSVSTSTDHSTLFLACQARDTLM